MKPIRLSCIIDDDPIYIFGLRRCMEISNFCQELLIFNNGKEALEAFLKLANSEASFPEVVFLDIDMPIMDGWEFLDNLSCVNFKKPITIYLVSSSINPADINRAKKSNKISQFYSKPITHDMLKKMLSEHNLHQA